MRKISKSRNEDDVVSSTNGSEHNDGDDKTKSEQAGDEKNESHNDSNGENGDREIDSDDEPVKTPAKKKGGKSKSKKKSVAAKDDEEEEYEVEKVVGSKKIKGKLHYQIRWKGYSADSDTWEPENTLSCPDLIAKYNQENGEKTPSKSGSKKRKGKSVVESKASPKKKVKTQWDGEDADKNAEYEVERILEVHQKKNGAREFLIHWKGWSNKFDSWEPENHLNCSDLIKKFMDKVDEARSKESRTLRVAPESTNRFTLQAPSTGRRLSKRGGQKQRVRYDDAE